MNPVRRGAAAALLALSMVLGACGDSGSQGATDGSVTTTTADPLAGVGTVTVRIRPAGQTATTTEQCAYLADTAALRAKGLMTVTDLRGHVGMVFRFDADVTSGFYMRNTPTALSIAWFDAAGRFVSAADMAPCDDRTDCPTYPAAGAYRYALEVPQRSLGELGVGPGAVIELAEPCHP